VRSAYLRHVDLCRHEAAHAVVAIFLGIPITEVRVDRPDVGVNGWTDTRVVWTRSRGYARKQLLAVMAGPREGGTPLTWTDLDLEHPGDAGLAARIVGLWGFDATEWFALERRLEQLRSLNGYHRALRDVGIALERRERLTGDEVRAILAAVDAPR
jgi:hypothetical protein